MSNRQDATRRIAVILATGAVAVGAATPTPAIPRRHVVEIQGMAFHPETVTVQQGDTIVWINRDIVPHTATSASKPEWTTGQLAQGASGTYVARRKGAEQYVCQLHPTMVGAIVVR